MCWFNNNNKKKPIEHVCTCFRSLALFMDVLVPTFTPQMNDRLTRPNEEQEEEKGRKEKLFAILAEELPMHRKLGRMVYCEA